MISQKKQQLQSAATSRKILSSVFLNPFLFFKLPFWLQLIFGSINQSHSHSYLLNLARATYD